MNTKQNPSFSALPQTLQGCRIPFVQSGGSFIMEIWKAIYVDRIKTNYEVSTIGRVRSLGFDYIGSNKQRIVRNPRIRKDADNNGYRQILLSVNKKQRPFKIHRLVALAFIPNPENKRTVNHKNGIKDDNRVQNLEWATHSENSKHKYRVLGEPPVGKGVYNNIVNSRPIVQLSPIDGKEISRFPSINEAYRQTGIGASTIGNQLSGLYKTAGGFIWEYLS